MFKRIASSMIAIIGLFVAYDGDGLAGVLCAGFYLLLPLACIWYSNEFGSHRNPDNTHPPLSQIVAFGGWILIFVPIIIGVARVVNKH